MVVIKGFPFISMIKGIFALILIMSMEILISRRRKGETHSLWWGVFSITLIVILLIGFHVI
ncbi:DUF1516 family protein [Bacillus pseudomycoides]|uniref:DUF1516 family protein n=1 Tax=Bacillus pseudomycoides TaxID=64104 RepID=UPI003D237EE7